MAQGEANIFHGWKRLVYGVPYEQQTPLYILGQYTCSWERADRTDGRSYLYR